MASLVKNNKGGITLILDDYRYNGNLKLPSKDKIYWRCVVDRCRGRATSNFVSQLTDDVRANMTKPHDHESEELELAALEVVRCIKQRSQRQPNERPLNIVQEEIAKIQDEDVVLALPERANLFRTINRHQNKTRPPIPSTLSELEIEVPYNVTKNGHVFLQLFLRSPEAVVMFYTEDALRLLCQSTVIFGDGTFKVSPRIFYQLYTIHGLVFGTAFPLVYCLTSRKTESTYNTIFKHLKEHAQALQLSLAPPTIMTDFEKATMNASRTVFPASIVKGKHDIVLILISSIMAFFVFQVVYFIGHNQCGVTQSKIMASKSLSKKTNMYETQLTIYLVFRLCLWKICLKFSTLCVTIFIPMLYPFGITLMKLTFEEELQELGDTYQRQTFHH